MQAKQYTVFPRKPKSKNKRKPIYQVRFRDPASGKRLSPITTNQTSKSAAEKWAMNYLMSGKLSYRLSGSFEHFARGWFEYKTCPYINKKLSKDRDFSEQYARECESRLRMYILPYFKKYKMVDIRVPQLEAFLQYLNTLRKKNGEAYSSSHKAHIFNVLKMMMQEAYANNLIPENYCNRVENFTMKGEARGAYSLELFYRLFNSDTLVNVWDNNQLYRTISLVAATTGMRMGEVLGLTFQHVHNGYIDVEYQWNREKKKLVEPKAKSRRRVSIPEITNSALMSYIDSHPNKGIPEAIMFTCETDYPVDHKAVRKAFYKALNRVGIDEEQRKKEGWCFHSWRHTFNTLMIDGIGRDKTRNLTGHKSDRMTENYNHPELASLQEAKTYQDKIFRN